MSKGLMTNLYELLGIDCHADYELINQQFVQLSQTQLPLNEKIQIYQAYRILSDRQKRQQYDRTLLMGLLDASPESSINSPPQQTSPHQAIHRAPLILSTPTGYGLEYSSKQALNQINEPEENQREYTRLPYQKSIVINNSIETSTFDISPKGVQIQLPDKIHQNELINLQSQQLSGIAKICFIAHSQQGETIAGLNFLKVKFHRQLLISEYV